MYDTREKCALDTLQALLSESRIVSFQLRISMVLYTILPQYVKVKAQSYKFKVSDHQLTLIYYMTIDNIIKYNPQAYPTNTGKTGKVTYLP